MHDFVRGCAARTVGRARDPLPIPAYAIPSGPPATAWYFRTDVALPPQRPLPTFPAPQNDPPTIADAPAPLRRNRCPVFEIRKVRAPSPQKHFDMLPADPLAVSFEEGSSRDAGEIGHLERRPAHLLLLR